MYDRAPKYTRVEAGSTNEEIESHDTITVFGITVTSANETGGTINFKESDGTTIFNLFVNSTCGPTVVPFKWLADKGLNVTTPANVECTVWHSQGGA